MAGPLPSAAIAVVQKYADGSPFMATAVLRGMVEARVLFIDDELWQVDFDMLTTFQAADDASEILIDRLSQLPRRCEGIACCGSSDWKGFQP